MEPLILGLNTDHGDAAAALVGRDGIIAALAEERLSRKKHTAEFPKRAIAEVLRIAGADVSDLTDIAVARDPRANLLAKLFFVLQRPRHGVGVIKSRLRLHRRVRGTADRMGCELGVERSRISAQVHQVEHHLAHVASAFYWSPFDSCAALTIDGAGDFATTMWAKCSGRDIQIVRRSTWPHSLGVFYTAMCQFIGFDKYGEEYKVMGLSAYGEDRYSELMRQVVQFDPVRGLRLSLRYFQHHRRRLLEEIDDGEVRIPRLYSDALAQELGPPRDRRDEIGQRERDLSTSMQKRYEEVFLHIVRAVTERTQTRRLVLAGGCALNSVANGRMFTEGCVDDAYFQPAATDDGTGLGAALKVLHQHHGVGRTEPVIHAYWGRDWSETEIERACRQSDRPYRRLERPQLLATAVEALAAGRIMGWFHGREEWGPRALGNRSILCNPAWPEMKATLNARIKNRESFRPFAPVIRQEDLAECFEGTHPVPFMIAVYKVRARWRQRLPAITHEDGTGRVQTVTYDQNPIYYDLIGAFKQHTGVPVLLNTSFNENEPIVHTPEQALACFERTKMDALGIGPFWLEKS